MDSLLLETYVREAVLLELHIDKEKVNRLEMAEKDYFLGSDFWKKFILYGIPATMLVAAAALGAAYLANKLATEEGTVLFGLWNIAYRKATGEDPDEFQKKGVAKLLWENTKANSPFTNTPMKKRAHYIYQLWRKLQGDEFIPKSVRDFDKKLTDKARNFKPPTPPQDQRGFNITPRRGKEIHPPEDKPDNSKR